MFSRYALFVGILLSALFLTAPAQAERRVAFVVGNAAYSISRLSNPVNDANDVAGALGALGFDVVKLIDADLDHFDRALETFKIRAHGADVALFYYAGHAMQFEDQNWLMPVDTDVSSPGRLRSSNISLQNFMRDLEGLAPTTLVFLDACRTSEIADRFYEGQKSQGRDYGSSRGLAQMEVRSPQTLLVFATKPGGVAQDGTGRNSPFSAAFLQHVKTPGIEIELLMKRVTQTVSDATGRRQQPERLSRLTSEFYFVSPEAAKPAPEPAASSADATARADFALAKASGSLSAWDAFLARYPDGFFAALAKAEREKLVAASVPLPAAATPAQPRPVVKQPSILMPLSPANPKPTVSAALPDRRGQHDESGSLRPARYSYVWDTRPPDDWLALRSEPTSKSGYQIEKMENGTLLDVIHKRADGWWRVRVVGTGAEGWALSGQGSRIWIYCCRSP